MKNKKSLLLLLVAASTLLMPSCKKKDDPTPTPATPAAPVTPAAKFSAKINGTTESWGTNYYQAISGGTYIAAFSGGQPKIQLAIMSSQAVGTYPIDMMVMASYWDASSVMHIATSGTITITSYANNKVSGTFSFVEDGTDGVTVTNGVFTDIPKL